MATISYPRKPDPAKDRRIGIQRQDYVTLDSTDRTPVFICWRDGARLPQSYHRTEAAALAWARRRALVGQTICILRAEIIGGLHVGEPVVSVSGFAGRGEPQQPADPAAPAAMFPFPVKPPIG